MKNGHPKTSRPKNLLTIERCGTNARRQNGDNQWNSKKIHVRVRHRSTACNETREKPKKGKARVFDRDWKSCGSTDAVDLRILAKMR